MAYYNNSNNEDLVDGVVLRKGVINEDYIVVLRKKGESLVREDVEIKQLKVDFLKELESMVNDDSKSLADMRDRMGREFPARSRARDYYWLAPHLYWSSFVSSVGYPRVSEGEDDDKTWESLKANCSEKESDSKHEEFKRKKSSYYSSCEVFCKRAYSYNVLIDELSRMGDVKMWSTSRCAYRTSTYKVADDISVTVRTNFGYGCSSYLMLSLNYKGIEIKPFSHLVKYFYANAFDIIRCTRNYKVDWTSWAAAMQFVVYVCEEAKKGEAHFVAHFVRGEVNALMSGLRMMLIKPERFFNLRTSSDDESKYINVRHVNGYEREDFVAYRREMMALVKAEKISGALNFLGKIVKLNAYCPNAIDTEIEIRKMAITVLMEVKSLLPQVEIDINERKEEEAILSKEIDGLKEEKVPHEEAISERKKKAKEAKAIELNKDIEEVGLTLYEGEDIVNQYKNETPEYVSLLDTIREKGDELYKLKNDIQKRENLQAKLIDFRKKIEEHEALSQQTA